MTPAEKKLWKVLRGKQLDGLFFRRQHAVGSYIVDFFCAKGKLVIELDSDSHLEQEEYDKERTHWLEGENNYRVKRFTNDDIFYRIHEVIKTIRETVKRLHHLNQAINENEGNPPTSKKGYKWIFKNRPYRSLYNRGIITLASHKLAFFWTEMCNI